MGQRLGYVQKEVSGAGNVPRFGLILRLDLGHARDSQTSPKRHLASIFAADTESNRVHARLQQTDLLPHAARLDAFCGYQAIETKT